jgi:hypothetical protein
MNFRNISLLFTRSDFFDSRKINSLILTLLLLLTFTFSIKSITGHEASGATTCANLPITATLANGAQSTNPASEAADNDAATRWSNEGLGSWIRLDLGSQKTVCSVNISWYNGNQRQNTFEIAVSNDGNTFTKIFSSKSSGTTTAAEKYDVTDSPGRYVKITVTGNTQSDWVSINEIDIFGISSTDTTKPTVTSTSPGGGTSKIPVNIVIKATFSEPMSASSVSTNTFALRIADTTTKLGGAVSLSSDGKTATFDPSANLATSTRYVATIFTGAKDLSGNDLSQSKKWSFTTAAGGTSGGTDKFGIKKIYNTKSSGEEWYMDMKNPTGDNRFNPQNTITKNSDGSWKMKSSKVRMGVYTSSGYSSSKIPTLDHSKIASKGYMLAPNDWKNIEMTMYTKVNKAGSDDNFAPYGRGGRHTGGGAPEGCEGSAYKGDLFFSGKVRFAKEQWHVSYVFTNYETGTSSIKGKWVGFKFVLYNFQDSNGKTAVKTEFWLDENNKGTFVKVDENVDRGGWGNEGKECNGAPDQIITWGGPIATFRWDTATDVDFKNLSVREIQPPQ